MRKSAEGAKEAYAAATFFWAWNAVGAGACTLETILGDKVSLGGYIAYWLISTTGMCIFTYLACVTPTTHTNIQNITPYATK